MKKNQKKKIKKHLQKQTKKLPTFLSIIAVLGVLLYFLKKNETENIKESQKVKIEILYNNCLQKNILGLKTHKRGIIKFKYLNKKYNLKLGKSICKNLKIGDSLELFYNKEKDKFYEIKE